MEAAWASRLYLRLPSWALSLDLGAHSSLVAYLESEAQEVLKEEVQVVWVLLLEGLKLDSIRDRRDKAPGPLRLS